MRFLNVQNGPGLGQVFELKDDTTKLGRSSANHIVLDGKKVSRFHAEIVRDGDSFVLRDLNSSNGTFVNGVLVQSKILGEEDLVLCGEVLLQFTAHKHSTDLTEEDLDTTSDLTATSNLLDHPSVMVTDVEGESSLDIQETLSLDEVETFICERERSEAGAKGTHRALMTVYDMSEMISSTIDIRELFEKLCYLILKSVHPDSVYILLVDLQENRFEIQTGRHLPEKKIPYPPPISKTIVKRVIHSGHSVISRDAMHDTRFQEGESVTNYQLHSVMCVPLRCRDKILGVLYVTSEGFDCFMRDDLMLLTVIGNEAGVAIENVRLIELSIQKERLAAIGQTIAGMAHYIKNVIAGLRGGVDLIQLGSECQDDQQIKIGWDITKRSLDTVSNLVYNMLNYSKERKPNFQIVDVNKVLKQTIALIKGALEKLPISLIENFDPNLPMTLIDPDAIQHAVLNLLTNAIESIDEDQGGRITVTSCLSLDQNHVEVYVEDTGCGISPKDIPHVFDLFMSTKGAKGTGLGLAVSQKVIKEHKGNIWVESEVSKGSKFIIQLPVKETKNEALHLDL